MDTQQPEVRRTRSLGKRGAPSAENALRRSVPERRMPLEGSAGCSPILVRRREARMKPLYEKVLLVLLGVVAAAVVQGAAYLGARFVEGSAAREGLERHRLLAELATQMKASDLSLRDLDTLDSELRRTPESSIPREVFDLYYLLAMQSADYATVLKWATQEYSGFSTQLNSVREIFHRSLPYAKESRFYDERPADLEAWASIVPRPASK
jgi:hypothetical protein